MATVFKIYDKNNDEKRILEGCVYASIGILDHEDTIDVFVRIEDDLEFKEGDYISIQVPYEQQLTLSNRILLINDYD